ncbi:MAG TPA: ABC transporter ATP-binding protein/permease [Micavibrio sp.]
MSFFKGALGRFFKSSAASDSLPVKDEATPRKEPARLKSAWQLTTPYFIKSPQKWKARALLTTAVALTLTQVYVDVRLSDWGNKFYNTLSKIESTESISDRWGMEDDVNEQLTEFLLLALAFVSARAYRYKFKEKLALDWRNWMTQEMTTRAYSNNNYYKILTNTGIDNPDQRIAEDIPGLASSTLDLGLGGLRAGVSLPSFSYILWNMSDSASLLGVSVPGYLMFTAFAYAAIGTAAGVRIGKPLIPQNEEQQKLEAKLRDSLIGARNHAEAIALADGYTTELALMQGRMNKVVENKTGLIESEKRIMAFTVAYNQTGVVVPYFITLNRFLSKQVTLGDFTQCAGAFGQVQDDLSWFVDSYPAIAKYKATVNRLAALDFAIETVDSLEPEIDVRRSDSDAVRFHSLTLKLKDGTTLLSDFSLTLNPGERLVIAGDMGSGKSSIFRAMKHMWMHGSGSIDMPDPEKTLALPQRPYFPLATSLKGIITYPHPAQNYTDDEVAQALTDIGMGHLIPEMNDLEMVDEKGVPQMDKDGAYWASRLSGGQQQAIGIALALVQKPVLMIMDESTSAMDEASQDRLYKLITEKLPNAIIISVSHRPGVIRHHTLQARLENKKITVEPVVPSTSWNPGPVGYKISPPPSGAPAYTGFKPRYWPV